MTEISPLARLRFKQIRLFSKAFEKLSFHSSTRRLFAALGRSPRLTHALVGFRRTFSSFEQAAACTSRYNVPSHEHPANVATQHHFAESARVSDYPNLFYLQQVWGEIKSVLDIGGSAGNLFYCYAQYLKFPPDLRWTVVEVPQNVASGRAIAAARAEGRLTFTGDLATCNTADTVVISGSLHYFEALPSELIRHLDPKPKHVFINRTPVIDGPTVVTVQDAATYYAISPARILSRAALFECMSAAGYDLVDQWSVPELKLRIPLDPASSAATYSGFYFRFRS